jgi:hypothetical protein
MSLSNISKIHLDDLLLSLNNNENNSINQLEVIKSNHSQFAQLKLIAKQMEMLRNEAREIINSSNLQNELHKVEKKCKIVSGNYYYLYEKHNKSLDNLNQTNKYFSIISPEEWQSSNIKFDDLFLGKFYYDYDKQFTKH